jgi:hypothetical protein
MRGELSFNCLLDTILMPKICMKYTFLTSSFSNHTWNWLKKLWHDHCMKNKIYTNQNQRTLWQGKKDFHYARKGKYIIEYKKFNTSTRNGPL